MTYVTIPTAGEMAEGTLQADTLSLTTNAMVVISTRQMNSLTGVVATLTSTGAASRFKIEYTKNGVTWYSAMLNFDLAAGETYVYCQKTNASRIRISAQPVVPGVYGTVSVSILLIDTSIDPEFATAYSSEILSVTTSTETFLTKSLHSNALVAAITVEDAPIRWTLDYSAPTSTRGHLAPIGTTIKLYSSADMIRFIAIGIGGTATLHVTYSR